MFLTFDGTRLPFPLPGSGQDGWDILELPLRRLFFLVDIETRLEKKSVQKTFLLGSFRQLEDLIEGQTPDLLTIKCVNVVSTQKITGVYHWEMHRMAKLYHAYDLKEPDNMLRVYETLDGKRFLDPVWGRKLEEVGNFTEICDLS